LCRGRSFHWQPYPIENTLDNRDLLNQLSKLTTVAIENASLHEATMATLAKTTALNELSKLIHSKSDLAEIMQQSSETILDISSAMMVSVIEGSENGLWRDHTAYLSHVRQTDNGDISTAVPAEAVARLSHANKINIELSGNSNAQRCFETATAQIIDRGDDGSDISDHTEDTLQQWREQYQIGAALYLPLIHEQDTYGVLVLYRHISQPCFSKAEYNLLQFACNQISIAIYQSALLAKIRHDAYHDGLTQLPNRVYFEKRLAEAVASERFAATRFAVLFMDLDGFKSVNDTLDNLDDRATAITIASRLNQSLQSTLDIDGYKITISVSIGMSFYPTDGFTADELLKNADIAMYQAKGSGKNRIHCFDEQLALKYQERVRLETELRDAVQSDQIYVVYQPQIEPRSGRVVAVEALARWNHPVLGQVSPDKFIPIAEESGLITQIGERVLREACKQTRAWQKAGYQRLHVAVNISAQQFTQDNFEAAVFDALEYSGLKPGYLELEITENIVMENVSRVICKLNNLRAQGIQIAIDDFGTGYSSLRYLEDLPLDTLKIDRSFVNKLNHHDPQHSLVNTIILMASSFGITTVAEGVETRQQLQSVVELGCDYIQGYCYSRPVPASTLTSVIDKINARPLTHASA